MSGFDSQSRFSRSMSTNNLLSTECHKHTHTHTHIATPMSRPPHCNCNVAQLGTYQFCLLQILAGSLNTPNISLKRQPSRNFARRSHTVAAEFKAAARRTSNLTNPLPAQPFACLALSHNHGHFQMHLLPLQYSPTRNLSVLPSLLLAGKFKHSEYQPQTANVSRNSARRSHIELLPSSKRPQDAHLTELLPA